MKISSRRLRKIVRESLRMREICIHEIRDMGEDRIGHLVETKMLDIITNSYENVEDINILANYALRNDMQGALKDPELQYYIDNGEGGMLVDDSYGWLKYVGDTDQGMPPAPEGWDLDKIYDFMRRFEDESGNEWIRREKGSHDKLPNKKERELIGKALTMSYVMPDEIKDIEFQVRRSKGKITNINIENPDIVSNLNHEEVARAGFTMDDIIDLLRDGGAKERKKQKPIKHTPPMYD